MSESCYGLSAVGSSHPASRQDPRSWPNLAQGAALLVSSTDLAIPEEPGAVVSGNHRGNCAITWREHCLGIFASHGRGRAVRVLRWLWRRPI